MRQCSGMRIGCDIGLAGSNKAVSFKVMPKKPKAVAVQRLEPHVLRQELTQAFRVPFMQGVITPLKNPEFRPVRRNLVDYFGREISKGRH